MRKNIFLIITLLITMFLSTSTFAEVAYWKDKAFLCKAPDGYEFPAKVDQGQCSDGDSTLFNGIQCFSGNKSACDSIKHSQTEDGRMWRSPRRAQTNNLGKGDSDPHDLSFSDDQNQGVLLYTIATGDTSVLQTWMNWIESNRPPWIGEVKGMPRYCRPEGKDNCTLQPIYRDMIMVVAEHYKLIIPDGIMSYYKILNAVTLGIADQIDKFITDLGANLGVCYMSGDIKSYFSLQVTTKLKIQSCIDSSGFPLHLDAVRALILTKIGLIDPDITTAIETIVTREPNNAFFRFIRDGATQEVADLVMKLCPSSLHPVTDTNFRIDYLWEQSDSANWTTPYTHQPEGTVRTALWDCLTMYNFSPGLYKKGIFMLSK